jgi:hypothetical protein
MQKITFCPKHVELILKINKHCYLLHLVGSWFYYIAYIEDAQSNTNQKKKK